MGTDIYNNLGIDLETDINNKHVVVTGAAGGIGIEIVKQFLGEGAKVTATYHSKKGGLESLVDQNKNMLALCKADLTKEADVKKLFSYANSKFERVDILVSNAGIANPHSFVQDISLNQWNNTIRTNLTSAFLCSKYFFQNLQKYANEQASIVFIGSTAGLFGEAGFCDYATSKAGMHGLIMSLKNEIAHLASRGRVNLVNPGWTLTPMAEEVAKDKEKMKRILQTIPMKKIATPKDIASVVVYLSSDSLAGHISGQTITIAGGMEGRVLYNKEETGL